MTAPQRRCRCGRHVLGTMRLRDGTVKPVKCYVDPDSVAHTERGCHRLRPGSSGRPRTKSSAP